jgi:anti-sigma-K factor RskA
MHVGPDHERWEDAAGTYVLGALPDDEKRSYEAHMEVCPVCRAEADELSLAANLLPVSPPAMKPPPALKARIMAEVEREAALLASAGEPRREPAAREKRSWRDRMRLPMPALAMASATQIAGVLGGVALFGGSGAKTVQFASTLPQASAELEMTDDGAMIVAKKLPPVTSGRTYMVWLKRPGRAPEPTSALFTPRRDGSATASVTGDMDGVEAVLVNTEPLGGSTTPTSDVLLTASLT